MQSLTHGVCNIGQQSCVADYVHHRPVQTQILQQLTTTSYEELQFFFCEKLHLANK